MDFLNPSNDVRYKCLRPKLVRVSVPTAPLRKKVYKNAFKRESEASWKYLYTQSFCMPVSCGVCENCHRLKRRQWTARLANEMISLNEKYHDNAHTYFITLSLNDNYCPPTEFHERDNLFERETYRYVQSLFKRLRRGANSVLPELKFRYYVVGEFGDSANRRFHYHILLFLQNNDDIPDYFESPTSSSVKDEYKCFIDPDSPFFVPQSPDSKKPALARHWISSHKRKGKKSLKRLQSTKEATFDFILRTSFWSYGLTSVGSADTLGAASYLAKYSTKGMQDDRECFIPFHRQSKMIGIDYFEQIKNDILYNHRSTMRSSIDGKYPEVPLPRSVIRKYALEPAHTDKQCKQMSFDEVCQRYENDNNRIRRLPLLLSSLLDDFLSVHPKLDFIINPNTIFENERSDFYICRDSWQDSSGFDLSQRGNRSQEQLHQLVLF